MGILNGNEEGEGDFSVMYRWSIFIYIGTPCRHYLEVLEL